MQRLTRVQFSAQAWAWCPAAHPRDEGHDPCLRPASPAGAARLGPSAPAPVGKDDPATRCPFHSAPLSAVAAVSLGASGYCSQPEKAVVSAPHLNHSIGVPIELEERPNCPSLWPRRRTTSELALSVCEREKGGGGGSMWAGSRLFYTSSTSYTRAVLSSDPVANLAPPIFQPRLFTAFVCAALPTKASSMPTPVCRNDDIYQIETLPYQNNHAPRNPKLSRARAPRP